MPSQRPTKEHIDAVHRYFARKFPSSRQLSRWDEDIRAQIFEIENGAVLRRIVMDGSVLWDCLDGAAALSLSDLADYMREVRTPSRCFDVRWQGRTLHIRSKPL
jgi:hypothetical protein